jgi:hypothetical protein
MNVVDSNRTDRESATATGGRFAGAGVVVVGAGAVVVVGGVVVVVVVGAGAVVAGGLDVTVVGVGVAPGGRGRSSGRAWSPSVGSGVPPGTGCVVGVAGGRPAASLSSTTRGPPES